MCGIIGAIADRDITDILVEGLKRLEYRGYDSAGVAMLDQHGEIRRQRVSGRVRNLQNMLRQDPAVAGNIGIAHTRWATHGEPSKKNAHPHICNDQVALVHNGIIENHESLHEAQELSDYRFTSNTDTEVIVHQVHSNLVTSGDLFKAMQKTVTELEGAFSLAVITTQQPDCIVVARKGSPLVIGLGEGENFIASDVAALVMETRNFIFLEEGDVARITSSEITIVDHEGNSVERDVHVSSLSADAVELGNYRHYMLKEIYEQPQAISDTLEGRLSGNHLLDGMFGHEGGRILDGVRNVQIIACGTSYHAGLVARYWLEGLAGVSCRVEVAS